MFFFFRKPKIQIDCFVPEKFAFAANYAPIQKASKFLPPWFRELPSLSEKDYLYNFRNGFQRNVKGCPGIVDTIFNGFIMPSWCDLIIGWNENEYDYHFSDEISSITQHDNHQAKGFADNFWILKLYSPWILKFNKQVTVHYAPLTYHYGMDFPMKTLHGYNALWPKTNAMFTNQFMLFKKTEPGQVLIKHNKPLLHLQIPLEYQFDIKCHVDEKEYNRLHAATAPRISFYKTLMKAKAIYRNKK